MWNKTLCLYNFYDWNALRSPACPELFIFYSLFNIIALEQKSKVKISFKFNFSENDEQVTRDAGAV